MFCKNCGKPLDDDAKFCPNCGVAVSASAAPAADATPAADPGGEAVVREGLCNRVKSKLFVQNGHGVLTNRRFIYGKHTLAKIAAMGVFVNLTKGEYEFDIPLSDIAGIRDGRQGVSKTIIITTKSGAEYNFYFTDREKWLADFRRLSGC